MPKCAGCSATYEDKLNSCPYCGRNNPQPKFLPPTPPQTRLVCPICGLADRVEKVTSILDSQTQQITGQIPVSETYSDNDGKIHSTTYYRNYSGTQYSNLANKLIPPAKPKMPEKAGWYLTCQAYSMAILTVLSVCFVGFEGVVGLFTGHATLIGILSFFGVFLLILLFWGLTAMYFMRKLNKINREYPIKVEETKQNLLKWEKAMQNWTALYYCYRDSSIFIPGRHAVSVDRMSEYIYSE